MEILSQEVVGNLPDSPIILFFIPLILIALICFAGTVVAAAEGAIGAALCGAGLVVAAVVASVQLHDAITVERTEYKVIVEDFNELHEDYKIIDQEGEIYTVVKKTEGDNE